MTFQATVTAAELPTLLDRAGEGISILSLDCFDTLLWRNCQAPNDVFADLPIPGGAGWARVRAEARARKTALFSGGGGEVSIEDIYRMWMPAADAAEIDAAVARELAAEARHCFAFAPTVALMRAAKAKGLETIIVSDTYLSEPQLRALIAATAGQEVIGLIDRIFCSSEYGVGKANGLFDHVLSALGVAPAAILHAGDNVVADQRAPAALGIRGVHFRQFDAAAEQRLRLEAAAAMVLDGAVRRSAPAYQPHRPAISLREEQDSAWALGHDVLGPILHAFAGWVKGEAAGMAARTGRPVKILFLLRDGHLPQRVFEAITGESAGAIEVSRFTARRASFTGEGAVRAYLASQTRHGRVDVLARQLGLSAEEGRALGPSQDKFARAVFTPATLRKIVKRSEAFADRLFAHLETAGVARGDAVMLVDLGYNGTVQNHIAPMLRERFDLDVAGRYLLLREEELTGLDKKGFFDARNHDLQGLHALSGPIAVLEQLCTVAQGSVVAYDAKGRPVRKGAGAKGAQNDIRDRIQAAAVAFARDPERGRFTAPASDDGECRRRAAFGALGRLLFMPCADEIALLEAFEHDVNLGTDDQVQLLDVAQSAAGLRRRGLFYLNQAERMFLPGEIQPHGLPLTLSLFAVNRLGLELRNADFRAASIALPVMLADARGQTLIDVEAHATHDGYYLATVPVGAGRFAVGVSFGAVCEWLQIDECAFHPVEAFGPNGRYVAEPAIPAEQIREGMTEDTPGLLRCGPEALLLVPPPATIGPGQYLLALVFRPIGAGAASQLRQAA
jgi:FMN phosphatase YigB (HAD superfamily)